MITTYGQKISIIVGLGLASFYFIYIHHSGQWLIPTDTYYYIALSDSLLETGKLQDVTNIPPLPLRTYQNGMPYLYSFLKIFGFNNFFVMRMVSSLNFLVWVSAIYPFFRLIGHFGIASIWSRSFLLLGFCSSSFLLTYQFTPGTDGFFNGGAIWLVYLLILLSTAQNKEKEITKAQFFWVAFSCFFVSILLVHFSLRLLFYLSAFLISTLLCKNEGKAKIILFAFSLLFITIISLILPYLVFDPGVVGNEVNEYNFTILNRAEPLRIMFARYFGAGSLFKLINGYIILFIFLILLFCRLVQGYLKNKLEVIFVSLSITIFLLVTFLLPNPVMVQAGARYMISTLPLFGLLIMSFKFTRPVAYTLIIVSTIVTLINLATPFPRYCISHFWTNLVFQQSFVVPENTVLLTDRGRYAYVFLKGRNYSLPLSSLDISTKQIWLAGSSKFIERKLKLLNEMEAISVKRVNVLLSDNLKACLSALVQCDVTIIKSKAETNLQPD